MYAYFINNNYNNTILNKNIIKDNIFFFKLNIYFNVFLYEAYWLTSKHEDLIIRTY